MNKLTFKERVKVLYKRIRYRKPDTITKLVVTLIVAALSWWVLGLLINWLGVVTFFKLAVWLYIGRLWVKLK